MAKNVKKDVLAKIKQDKLKPRSKTDFILHEGLKLAVALGLSIICGLAIAVIINTVAYSIRYKVPQDALFTVITSLLVLATLYSLGLVYRSTDSGYRFKISTLIILAILISLALSLIVTASGFRYSRIPGDRLFQLRPDQTEIDEDMTITNIETKDDRTIYLKLNNGSELKIDRYETRCIPAGCSRLRVGDTVIGFEPQSDSYSNVLDLDEIFVRPYKQNKRPPMR